MVKLLLYALLGAAVLYGWHAFRRQRQRVTEALKKAESSLNKKESVQLERDPETGVYRPARRDE